MAQFTIGVIGNPNSGKTTFFNAVTGSNQKVGNWPGVTVEKKEGSYAIGDNKIKMVDLPGIYSLSANSEDERIALGFILSGEMDLIVNIVDATNLERNLYLTTQLAEMRIPMVVILNMLDIAASRDMNINIAKLSKMLGCPVYAISAIEKNFVDDIKDKLFRSAESKPDNKIAVNYPEKIKNEVDKLKGKFSNTAKELKLDENFIALQVLEKNRYFLNAIKQYGESIPVDDLNAGTDLIISENRYNYTKNVTNAVLVSAGKEKTVTDIIDSVVLNRLAGIPIFLFAMYMTFWLTLSIGGAFIDFFDIAFGAIFVDGLTTVLNSIGAPGWLISFAAGIGAGIQTVSTFIPIVFVMFLCLALLEDSGYMARAAFVMDRFMKQIGLPGKSFVPLLVGFGCTVPAIMAARTLESTRDRILTVFMTPFMSCGARLPVYALFAAAFFNKNAGLVVFSLYLVGGLLAIFTGLMLKNTLFKGEPSYFVMELPPYHAPRIFTVIRSAWVRLKGFIFRAGKVIIIGVAVLGFFNSLGTDGSFGNEDGDKSVLSVIGKTITPVFSPMGIEKENWPATVAIFTGLFAKEAVVGTMNSLYMQNAAAEESETDNSEIDDSEFSLTESLKEALDTIPANLLGVADGLVDPFGLALLDEDDESKAESIGADSSLFSILQSKFNKGPVQAYAYLVFILLYVPCLAAVSAIVREIGNRYAVILVAYLFAIGWVTATLVYQIGVERNPLWIAVPCLLLGIIVMIFRILGNKETQQS